MRIQIALILIAILILSGCKDISGSYKPGSFGKSAEDQTIQGYYKAKFGDLTASGDPRFLEPFMSSDVVDYIPKDKVLKFGKESNKLFAWFVYDNFADKDEIDVEWKYVDKDFVIYTFKSEAGGDFGRGVFTLERPDDGWPLGKYQVTITGRGVKSVINFEIIEGASVTEPLPFDTSKFGGSKQATSTTSSTSSSANTPPSDLGEELMGNGNIGGCSYTDTSTWTVPSDVYVTKLRMWYHWEQGETTLPYTLTKDGSQFQKGELVRGNCDPYQTSWCEANWYPAKDFPAGAYVLKAETARLCQNSESKGNGMYVIYGKKKAGASASDKNYYQVDFTNGNHKRMIKGGMVDGFKMGGLPDGKDGPLVWVSKGMTPEGHAWPSTFSWDVPSVSGKTLAFASSLGWAGPDHDKWVGKKLATLNVQGANGASKSFDIQYGVHTQEWTVDLKTNKPTVETVGTIENGYESRQFVNRFDIGGMTVTKITIDIVDMPKWNPDQYATFIVYGIDILK